MCLIAIAWQARRDLPLMVAANRDEWRERPTKAAHWWPERTELLAGRDLRAGGTWMGITRGGRFAAVTNFRDPSDKRSTARSRGTLVTEFLFGNDTPARFLANLSPRAHEYNGFNIIVGDGVSLFYFGSREGHGLTYTSCRESGKFRGLFRLVASEMGVDDAIIRTARKRGVLA